MGDSVLFKNLARFWHFNSVISAVKLLNNLLSSVMIVFAVMHYLDKYRAVFWVIVGISFALGVLSGFLSVDRKLFAVSCFVSFLVLLYLLYLSFFGGDRSDTILINLMIFFHFVVSFSLYRIKAVASDLRFALKDYIAPIHEISHFIFSEKMGMFVSDKIVFVPDSVSSARFYFRVSEGLAPYDEFKFCQILLAGSLSIDYLFYKIKFSHDYVRDVIRTELLLYRDSEACASLLSLIESEEYCRSLYLSSLRICESEKDVILRLSEFVKGKKWVKCSCLLEQIAEFSAS